MDDPPARERWLHAVPDPGPDDPTPAPVPAPAGPAPAAIPGPGPAPTALASAGAAASTPAAAAPARAPTVSAPARPASTPVPAPASLPAGIAGPPVSAPTYRAAPAPADPAPARIAPPAAASAPAPARPPATRVRAGGRTGVLGRVGWVWAGTAVGTGVALGLDRWLGGWDGRPPLHLLVLFGLPFWDRLPAGALRRAAVLVAVVGAVAAVWYGLAGLRPEPWWRGAGSFGLACAVVGTAHALLARRRTVDP